MNKFQLTIWCVWIFLQMLRVTGCPNDVAAISMSAKELRTIVIEYQSFNSLQVTLLSMNI